MLDRIYGSNSNLVQGKNESDDDFKNRIAEHELEMSEYYAHIAKIQNEAIDKAVDDFLDKAK